MPNRKLATLLSTTFTLGSLSCCFILNADTVTSPSNISNAIADLNYQTEELVNPLEVKNQMIYLKYHILTDYFDKDLSLSHKKIWRVGTQYFRSEEASEPDFQQPELVIVSEPDVWVVDSLTNMGIYSYDTHSKVQALIFENLGLDSNIEFGEEVYFFKKNHAQETKKDKIIIYTLDNPQYSLVLSTNTDSIPLSLSFNSKLNKGSHSQYTIVYDDYAMLKPDYKKFTIKDNITILNKKITKHLVVASL